MNSLNFVLSVEDGWPPVSSEEIPCNKNHDGYEILGAPVFVKSISVGDVIRITEGSEKQTIDWEHVSRSANTTIWLLRLKEDNSIAAALSYLRNIGCDTVSLAKLGSYSINVPADVDIDLVDHCLSLIDVKFAVIAYPSFRH